MTNDYSGSGYIEGEFERDTEYIPDRITAAPVRQLYGRIAGERGDA